MGKNMLSSIEKASTEILEIQIWIQTVKENCNVYIECSLKWAPTSPHMQSNKGWIVLYLSVCSNEAAFILSSLPRWDQIIRLFQYN